MTLNSTLKKRHFLQRSWIAACFLAVGITQTTSAQTVRTAASGSQLNAAIAASAPGDTIVMMNGVWTDVSINFGATATATRQVVLRAQTPGKVILTGASTLTFSAPNLVASGLCFKGGALSSGAIVNFNSSNCRLTNTAFIKYNPPVRSTSYYWVYFKGSYNRMDKCYFTGKNHHQPAVGNHASGARYNKVDSCFFQNMGGSGNGSEIFRVWGYGRYDEMGTDGAFFTIENNLFDAAETAGRCARNTPILPTRLRISPA